MIALIRLLLALLAAPFRSKSALEAENAALRQQIIVLRRTVRGPVELSNGDRLFFVWLYRLFPSIFRALLIVRPDTLIRWHRAGFRRYWRWKSRGRIGRPQVDHELRALIRRMTQQQVASWLRKPQSFVSKYENGERRLDVAEFIGVLDVLGHDPRSAMDAILASDAFARRARRVAAKRTRQRL